MKLAAEKVKRDEELRQQQKIEQERNLKLAAEKVKRDEEIRQRQQQKIEQEQKLQEIER